MNRNNTITHHTLRTGWLSACCVFLAQLIGAILPNPAITQAGSTFDYTAIILSKAARQGTVDASGILWQCTGSRCTVSGSWAQPGVMACRALAQQVGRIKSYGHPGASLNATQLAECNDGAASPAVSNKNVVVQPSQQTLPSTKNKSVTPGPVSGPQAETASNTPLAVLQTARPAGQLRTARQTWHCDGTRCTIPSLSGPLGGGDRSNDDCSRLAQAAGPVTWFRDGRATFDAEQLRRCNSPYVRSFEVLACSGADDLRDASHLSIRMHKREISYSGGTPRRILAMGIQANSCQTEVVSGPAFRLSELISVGIRFESFDSGAYQTDDNWDMTRFRILANVTEPGGRTAILQVMDEQRSPVKRFKGSNDYWEVELR